MTLHEIYNTYQRGSRGFAKAVEIHCGFNTSIKETIRIAIACATPEEFEFVWSNDDWWRDAMN